MWIRKTTDVCTAVKLLLIEDNPGDVLLAKEALREGLNIPYQLNVVTDGDAAIRYLFRIGEYAQMDTPDIVFLDLNLPKRDGKEILARVKQDKFLKTIPVIIFSTSEAEHDIQSSFNLQADNYVVKPMSYNDFVILISQVVLQWRGKSGNSSVRNRKQFVKRIA